MDTLNLFVNSITRSEFTEHKKFKELFGRILEDYQKQSNNTNIQHINTWQSKDNFQTNNVFKHISESKEVKDFVKEISSSFKSIDVLINNAGSLINKPFLEISSSDFEAVFKVNVFAVASLTRLMLPMMNAKGHVLNITSMGGVQGSAKFPGQGT